MQTVIRPVPKSEFKRYEKYDGLTEEMKARMTEYLLSLHGISENTKDDYLSKVKRLGIFLTKRGIMRFEDANSIDIDLFLSKYNNENTLNLYIYVFKSFYNYIKKSEVTEHLKLYKIELEQITPSDILTPEEIIALANETARRRELYKVVTLTLYESCARISEVLNLKLAYTVHKREDRNTFEKAELCAKMVETKKKESGGVKKVEVALDCQIDPNLLSQYLRIWRLYKVLKAKYPNSIKILKSMGINRLYNLSGLLDYPQLLDLALPKAIEKLKKNPRMRAKQIKQMVDQFIKPSNSETSKEPEDQKSDILQIDVPSDLTQEIKGILFWIEDIAEAKESKIHWTKRRKILSRFYARGLQTLDEIALECLRMGIEDVKYGRKVYPITLGFEVLHGVPIGFKGISKERPKLERHIERPPPPSITDFMPKEDIVSLNALRSVDKEKEDAKETMKIKLEFEDKEKDKN